MATGTPGYFGGGVGSGPAGEQTEQPKRYDAATNTHRRLPPRKKIGKKTPPNFAKKG